VRLRTLITLVAWVGTYLGLVKYLGYYAIESQYFGSGQWWRLVNCMIVSVFTVLMIFLLAVPVRWFMEIAGADRLRTDEHCLGGCLVMMLLIGSIALGVYIQ
jgi:uncharacterized membrane protein